jgi:hypothetical protein
MNAKYRPSGDKADCVPNTENVWPAGGAMLKRPTSAVWAFP